MPVFQRPRIEAEHVRSPSAVRIVLIALFEFRVWLGQLVAFFGYANVQGRQQEDAQQQSTNQSSDDHDGERPLRVRTDAARSRCWRQATWAAKHLHDDAP